MILINAQITKVNKVDKINLKYSSFTILYLFLKKRKKAK